jgi:methylated-DNA-[protein]-cysteine S-methyltransferase
VNRVLTQYYKSPFGELIIGSFENKIVLCDWRYRKMRASIDTRIQKKFNTNFIVEKSEVIDLTILQLEEYFRAERTEFNVPLKLAGTDFQKSVWNELLKIPFGETESYLGLSKKLGNEKAIRAVATANGANAISIIIPCHRIIGSDNSLVGYAGGLTAKKKLLEHENNTWKSQLTLSL